MKKNALIITIFCSFLKISLLHGMHYISEPESHEKSLRDKVFSDIRYYERLEPKKYALLEKIVDEADLPNTVDINYIIEAQLQGLVKGYLSSCNVEAELYSIKFQRLLCALKSNHREGLDGRGWGLKETEKLINGELGLRAADFLKSSYEKAVRCLVSGDEQVLTTATPLLVQSKSDRESYALIRLLKETETAKKSEPQKDSEMFSMLTQLLEGTQSPLDRAIILESIVAIPSIDRTFLVEVALSFLNAVEIQARPYLILALAELPFDQRNFETIALLISQISHLPSCTLDTKVRSFEKELESLRKQLKYLTNKGVLAIPSKLRKQVFCASNSLLEDVVTAKDRFYIIHAINKAIQEDPSEELLESAGLLFQKNDGGLIKARVIDRMRHVLPLDRPAVIKDTLAVLDGREYNDQGKVLYILNKIKATERHDLLGTTPHLDETETAEGRAQILYEMSRILPTDRSTVMRLVGPSIARAVSWAEKYVVIRFMRKTPPALRKEAIACVEALLDGVNDEDTRGAIAYALGSITCGRLIDLLETSELLQRASADSAGIRGTFTCLIAPADRLESVCLLVEFLKLVGVSRFLTTMRARTLEERRALLALAKHFLSLEAGDQIKQEILLNFLKHDLIKLLNPTALLEVVDPIIEMILLVEDNGENTENEKNSLMEFLNMNPPSEVAESFKAVQKLSEFFGLKKSVATSPETVRALSQIPTTERARALDVVQLFFKGFGLRDINAWYCEKVLILLLHILRETPPAEWAGLIELLVSACGGDSESQTMTEDRAMDVSLLKCVGKSAPTERKKKLEALVDLKSRVDRDKDWEGFLIFKLMGTKSGDELETCKRAAAAFMNADLDVSSRIFDRLLQLPESCQMDAMNALMELAVRDKNAYDRCTDRYYAEDGTDKLLAFLLNHAEGSRATIFDCWLAELNSQSMKTAAKRSKWLLKSKRELGIKKEDPLYQAAKKASIRCIHMKKVSCIPQEQRDFAVSILDQLYCLNKETYGNTCRSQSKTISFLFAQSPSLRDNILNGWIEELRSEDTKRVGEIVKLIHRSAEKFGILENDPVYQEAISAGIRIAHKNDIDSPYNFHARLKEKRAETVTIPSYWEVLDGVRFCTNPSFLPRLPQQLVFAKDLPETADFFKGMVENLRKKAAESSEFCETVLQQTGFRWDEINGGALGSNYLSNLLTFKNPEEIIYSTRLMFIRIVDALSHNGQGDFVACEMPFVKMLASIQSCITGKDEGIRAYYTAMQGGIAAKSSQEPIEFIHDLCLARVEQVVSGADPVFLKRLIGLKPHEKIEQLAHQSQYIRALVWLEFGLPNELKFDPHSRVLYEDLIEKSKQEVVNTFYGVFRGTALIQALIAQSKIRKDFFGKVSPLIDPKDLPCAFSTDTDRGECILTQFGALRVLEKAGVLTIAQ